LARESFCTAERFDETACGAPGADEAVLTAAVATARYERPAMWNRTCAFTISAWNNAAAVELWIESLLQFNPSLKCVAWFVADTPDTSNPLVDLIQARLSALRERWKANSVDVLLLTVDDVQRTMSFAARELAFRYTMVPFNTAIKPHVFSSLFASGSKSVIYFDPDCLFYSHLDEVALLLHWRSFVLIPHETWPTPDDGAWQTDLQLMRAGVFNYGFVAISLAHRAAAEHHLDWWGRKLRYQVGRVADSHL
jgi:hypothetical protein